MISYLFDLGMRDVGLYTLRVQSGAIDTDTGQHYVLADRSETVRNDELMMDWGFGARWEMGDDDGGQGDRKGKGGKAGKGKCGVRNLPLNKINRLWRRRKED
jgi:hypothetical protein